VNVHGTLMALPPSSCPLFPLNNNSSSTNSTNPKNPYGSTIPRTQPKKEKCLTLPYSLFIFFFFDT